MNLIVFFLAILSTKQAFAEESKSRACSAFAGNATLSFARSSTVITNSFFVPVGSLNVSNITNIFALCQVTGKVKYGGNETLNFEIWLPDVNAYTGRFMAVGGGGMAGVIDTGNMMLQLNRGFAVAGGDSGHLASANNNGSGSPGIDLPYLHNTDEVEAWIHNAVSLFTEPAKTLVALFYGEAATRSYFDGCSTGGAQGFALAQFHPHLFDGIIAGSPGNWYSHLALSFLWNGLKTQNESYLNQPILNLMTSAILDTCDTLDGVKDRLIENPLICQFDIAALACKSSATNTSMCLTQAQLTAARDIYRGPTDSRSGVELYPGFSLGSETEWILQEQQLSNAFSIPILQNLVFDNLKYDYRSFNFGSDVDLLNEKAGLYIDEINTNLTAFKNAGGKLLVTQGWADPFNAALWPIQHLKGVQDFFGHDVSDFLNLFMIPGGGHCGAASGYPKVPAVYHTVEKLVRWVETGKLPEAVISTDPPDGSNGSRLLCPWPKVAVYTGGNNAVWSNYVCEG